MEKIDINYDSESQYVLLRMQREIFEEIKRLLGDDVILAYDEEKKEAIIFKKPESFTEELIKIGSKIWGDINAEEYINQERNSWENFSKF